MANETREAKKNELYQDVKDAEKIAIDAADAYEDALLALVVEIGESGPYSDEAIEASANKNEARNALRRANWAFDQQVDELASFLKGTLTRI